MNKKSSLTEYEEILLAVIKNVVEKLTAAIILYDSKLSYTSSYYLTVITEEELAKLYILPIVNEFESLQEALADRKSAFYSHKIKQRIFSSYVYFDRNWEGIEDKKQSILYVGLNKNGKVGFCYIKQEECLREIYNAVWVFLYQMKHITQEKTLSKQFVDVCLFLNSILAGCIKDKIPSVITNIKSDTDRAVKIMSQNKKKAESAYYESLFKNPYEQIRILKNALGNDKYKNFLKRTHKLSFEDMVEELGKEVQL